MPGKLFLAAPPGTQWPLELDDAEAHLRARFPDVIITREVLGVSGEPFLNFRLELDGDTRHGMYVAHRNLVLSDGDPALWADTLAWFIGLLPPATPLAAMAEDEPTPIMVPAGTTSTTAIRQLYESLTAPPQ